MGNSKRQVPLWSIAKETIAAQSFIAADSFRSLRRNLAGARAGGGPRVEDQKAQLSVYLRTNLDGTRVSGGNGKKYHLTIYCYVVYF